MNDWKASYFDLMERSVRKIELLEEELQKIKQAIKDNWFIELNRHKRGGV